MSSPSNKEPTKSGDTTAPPKKKMTPIGGFSSIEEFSKRGLINIVAATKSISAFPQGSARDLYCAHPAFCRVIENQSDRILGLISKVIKRDNIKGNIQRRQQDEKFEMLLECNDIILERINQNLDNMSGIGKNQHTVVVEKRVNINSFNVEVGKNVGSWNTRDTPKNTMAARLITAKNITRPQINFLTPVDNKLNVPFIPRLKDKPNSLKPLAILPEYDDAGNIVSYLHPYEFELMKFEVSEAHLTERMPIKPPDMSSTEFAYVDTVPHLQSVLEELRQQKELAIDLEHHSYRSFMGFTCLLQISSRTKDYIFDALKLREELHILNNVFTNPKVIKIFHGADQDIEWLQRDLSLYVVNMFDTHQGSRALNYARNSLAYLLKHYCDIDADKTFQLADWRIRPLLPELIEYARQDTHFLIYIYDCMVNDLLKASNNQLNILRNVFQRSTELCKRRYVKPVVALESHLDMYRKSKQIFDNRQMYALREIFQWRDTVARREDESYGYVLPNHMLLHIADSLPREMQGILACCNPVPPLVRQHLYPLHQIILRARDQPLVQPILDESARRRVVSNTFNRYNSKLYCPHDLPDSREVREDLPTLLNFNKLSLNSGNTYEEKTKLMQEFYEEFMEEDSDGDEEAEYEVAVPSLTVFGEFEPKPLELKESENIKKRDEILSNIRYISPYQRYLAVLPLVEKERKEEAARMEAEMKKRKLCPEAEPVPVKTEEPKKIIPQETSENLSVKDVLRRGQKDSKKKKGCLPQHSHAPEAKRRKVDDVGNGTAKCLNLPPSKRQLKRAAAVASSSSAPPRHNESSINLTNIMINNEDSDNPPDEMPSTSTLHKVPLQKQDKPTLKKNKNKRRKSASQDKTHQMSSKQVTNNFDFSVVDFKKFKGGAQYAKGTDIKPQYHGKGNASKAKNKKLNKLFTFSNVKVNKK